jgi:uncharacterized protein (TIGR04255 family)
MGKVYETPPLIEALCEFQFEPGQPWDWTIPGLIYDKVKSEFPKKEEQNIIEMAVRAEQSNITPSIKGGVARMRFLRENKSALIQVGPDLLVVNHLVPYPTWNEFKKLIKDMLDIYQSIGAPKGIKRVSLRYINRLDVPFSQVEIEDYLVAVPRVPSSVPQVFATWLQRVEIPFPDSNGIMVLQSGSIRQENRTNPSFLLDLDFISINPKDISVDNAMRWVEKAHEEVEKAFEACITPKMRELMKEVSDG